MRNFKSAALAASIALALGSTAAFAQTTPPAPPTATQLPGQGAVVAGTATAGAITGGQQTITLGADSVIDWGAASGATINTGTTAQPGGFNIGSNAGLTFSGAFGVLNVDVSGNPSQIFGSLTGTGTTELYIANSNGIIVGAGAAINGGTGAVGLIGNTLINADGTKFTDTTYPAVVSYMGTGGDVTVQPGASVTGATVLVSGGGMVNVNLAALGGAVSLQAGLPNSTNALVKPNSGASLTMSGTQAAGGTLAQMYSAGDATNNAGTISTAHLTAGAGTYTPGTASFVDSDVAGTFTNNGVVTATTGGFAISGGIVNNGKIDSTGEAVSAGSISNLGSLLSDGITTTGAFANQGSVSDTGTVSVTGGDFDNSGKFETGSVGVVDGSIVNSGQLTLSAGTLTTSSDGTAANGFAKGGNYSITNTGTITSTSTSGLTLTANTAQTGGASMDANGSTGGIHDTGTLQLVNDGTPAAPTSPVLSLIANNNVMLGGPVETPNPNGNGYASTGYKNPLGSLTVSAGSYGNTAYTNGAGVFNATGTATITPDIFVNGNAMVLGPQVALMGNLGGDGASESFAVQGNASAASVAITAGATPKSGYAVRVAAGKTVEAGAITIDGDQKSDNPNVILQGMLASNSITFGADASPVGDIFSGPAGGLEMWNTQSPADPADDAVLAINSMGRVKTAPYLNDANNFRFNGLPVDMTDGSTVNLTVSADDMQGTPTSGYNLLVNGGVNLASTATAANFPQIITGTGSAVTGVGEVPNSHFALQATGDIATTGAFYWPGYIYLGNINADSNGNAQPGTMGTGTITLGGDFSNVLPGDVAGASGIHFITQFPLDLGTFTVATNANAWVNFGSSALTQLYSGQNGSTGPFFGGTKGSGTVVNYGPLAAADFVTQAPNPKP